MSGPGAAAVTVVGPFPPPVHGAAVITALMADTLAERATVERVNIAPDGLRRGLAYHLRRLGRVASALARVSAHGFGRGGPVYLSAAGGAGLLYDVVLAAAARVLGRALVVHHHSFAYLDRWDWKAALLARMSGARALHICLCPRMADLLARRYGLKGRVRVVSNAALLAVPGAGEAAPPPTAAKGAIRIGHLSNLSREKGFDLVIAAAEALGDDLGRLVLAGPCADDEAEALLTRARDTLGARLEYLGAVAGAAKDAMLGSIDLFLFPSRYAHEAEPIAVFEALAAGVPVIAFERGCIADQLAGDGGLLVARDGDFAAAAAAAARGFRDDPVALARARAAAREGALAAHRHAVAARDRLIGEICAPAGPDRGGRHGG